MKIGGPHCSDQQIERFLNEQLGPTELQAFEEHFEECQACQQAMMAWAAQPHEWQEARDSLQAAGVESGVDGGAGFPACRIGPSDRLGSLSHDSASSARSGDERPTGIDAVLRSLAPTDDPRMLGRLGPFEIQGVIGSGGMGVVLKGFDPALNRTVAVKVLAPHLAMSGSARRRFAREARAAAAVVHENVVAIHAVAEANGLPYFVMPYLRGRSLERRLNECGPLGVTEILRIGMQTAAGLAAAHAQGLVHRDVKPANILLEEGVERLMLTDFGLARAVDDASLTRTGVIAGTPQYMSPEQARGEAIDARSDLFSLGSVLYAMCTGRPPFRAETSYGILRRITDSEPRPIREVNPDIPDWLVAIIAKLHAKDPAQRFASADELARLLEQCLAHVQQPTAVPLPSAILATELASVETRLTATAPLPDSVAATELASVGARLTATAAPPFSSRSHVPLFLGLAVAGLIVLATVVGTAVRIHQGSMSPTEPTVPAERSPGENEADSQTTLSAWQDGVAEQIRGLQEATDQLETRAGRLWDDDISSAQSNDPTNVIQPSSQEVAK
jgi:serine/threonine-protein kinase